MARMETNDDRGAGEAMLKGSAARRVSSTSSGWRKILMCCLKPDEDDVLVLDYEHSSLTDVPAEVFNHERTLEILRLDCNQISDLPRPLFHCHGLKELWLSDNEISQLPPALATLIHLQVLSIFHALWCEKGRPRLQQSRFHFLTGLGHIEKRPVRSTRCY